MTTASAAARALDSDLDAIAACAARCLDEGAVVLDADGDPAGVTYYDAGTRHHYWADIDECRLLLQIVADGQGDAYSRWCSQTSASDEHDSAASAAAGLLQ